MIKLLLFILLIPIVSTAGINDKNYGSVIVTEVTSIYDGDTFRANLTGYPAIAGEHIGIRVNGIDTPEMRGKCEQEKLLARKAKKVAVEALRNGKLIELRNMKRGKYFRIVADVYIDGVSLGEVLLMKNMAVRYNGGKKVKNWCD